MSSIVEGGWCQLVMIKRNFILRESQAKTIFEYFWPDFVSVDVMRLCYRIYSVLSSLKFKILIDFRFMTLFYAFSTLISRISMLKFSRNCLPIFIADISSIKTREREWKFWKIFSFSSDHVSWHVKMRRLSCLRYFKASNRNSCFWFCKFSNSQHQQRRRLRCRHRAEIDRKRLHFTRSLVDIVQISMFSFISSTQSFFVLYFLTPVFMLASFNLPHKFLNNN